MDLEVKSVIQMGTVSEEATFVKNSLVKYNMEIAPTAAEPYSESINIILKDKEGHIIGGLLGRMYRFCLFVEMLWVDDNFRGLGLGKSLLTQVEDIAREKGCKLVHLNTFNFQAPDCFLKNGYELFGKLEGYPEGFIRYFLKKVI